MMTEVDKHCVVPGALPIRVRTSATGLPVAKVKKSAELAGRLRVNVNRFPVYPVTPEEMVTPSVLPAGDAVSVEGPTCCPPSQHKPSDNCTRIGN